MAAKRVVVVGNGRMAQLCSDILLRCTGADLRLVVAEHRSDAAQLRLARFCATARVPLLQPEESVNARAVVAAIAAEQPDFVFSIDNFQLFGRELLGVARCGSINFHNAPLARYRGMHAPSWAIFHGEREHGIAWHYMETAVDAGAVAAERSIALTGEETALSLTLECIRVGVEVFEREVDDILAGRRTPAAGVAAAKLYRRTDLPGGGVLDLRAPAAAIGRLLRATDFRPLPNPFTYVRVHSARGPLIVNAVEPRGPSGRYEAGEIVAADGELVAACADRLLAFSAVMLAPDEPADMADVIARLDLRPGQRFLPGSA